MGNFGFVVIRVLAVEINVRVIEANGSKNGG